MRSVVRNNFTQGTVVKTSELKNNAEYKRILRAVHSGDLVRVRHGVYAEPYFLMNIMIDVEKIVPKGLVCLFSAWSYHQLTTTIPSAYFVAVEAKRKIVLPDDIPIKLCYWKDEYLELGCKYENISGFNVKITDLERSVCDAVRYRNKVGIEVCAEILKTYLLKKERNLSRLSYYAKILRVSKTINNYLDVLLA